MIDRIRGRDSIVDETQSVSSTRAAGVSDGVIYLVPITTLIRRGDVTQSSNMEGPQVVGLGETIDMNIN